MRGNHPKRRKDKYNPYYIYEEDGRYYISFRDGGGIVQEFKISKVLYETFNSFELEDISYLNEWDRHIEHSEIWDRHLNGRAVEKPELVENIVFKNLQEERLHRAIRGLPEKQRRRLEMYYFENLTYEQIAEIEGCSFQAIAKSISAAIRKLKNMWAEC